MADPPRSPRRQTLHYRGRHYPAGTVCENMTIYVLNNSNNNNIIFYNIEVYLLSATDDETNRSRVRNRNDRVAAERLTNGVDFEHFFFLGIFSLPNRHRDVWLWSRETALPKKKVEKSV